MDTNQCILEALKIATDTKAFELGEHLLHRAPILFQEHFPGRKAVIIADRNTWNAAGEAVFGYMQAAGVPCECHLIEEEEFHADWPYVERLDNVLDRTGAVAVAVGSGVINDLTKLSSHLSGRRYMCVATAASMDGYTAFGASVTADGAKQTFSCPAPQACLADIDIIATAPKKMTSSGYADLFAKVTAGADWILADRLGIEPIDQKSWDIVQGGLADALSNPSGLVKGDKKALSDLVEGLILGGFAMQWSKSSRPASGAEHQFSHLWNMEHHTNRGEDVSHGFQVAIGTIASTALYEKLLETPVENLDIEKSLAMHPEAKELDALARKMFAGSDFPEIGAVESAAKYVDKNALRVELSTLKENWPEIKAALQRQIVPIAKLKETLRLAGAPTEPEEIGISREYLRESFVRAQFIRRRYTILDLAVCTGLFAEWLGGLFGKGGIWETETIYDGKAQWQMKPILR